MFVVLGLISTHYVGHAEAAVLTWADVGTAWSPASDWSPAGPPGSGDTALFNMGSYVNQPTVVDVPLSIGGIWDTGSGGVTISGGNTLTINGTTINGNANTGIELDAAAGGLTIAASVVSTAQTLVNGGTLQLTSNAVNAYKSATTIISSGAVLQWNPTSNVNLANGTTSYNGTGVIQKIGGSRLGIGGGSSTVLANLSTGAVLDIQGGDVNIGFSHQFQGSNSGGLNIAGGASYHSSDNSFQEDWLSGSGTLDNSFNNSLPVLYLGVQGTTNNANYGVVGNSASFSGVLGALETYAGNGNVHVNSLAVVKQGSGMQTLSGPGIQYSGSTSVTGGTLALVNLSNYNAYNAVSTGNGQTNQNGTGINLQNNATLLWNLASGANVHVNQESSGKTLNLTGTGTWRVTGAGTVQVGGQNSPVNINFAAGSLIDIEDTTYFRNEYGQGNWNNNQASMFVGPSATVDLWDSSFGVTVDALNGNGTVTHTSFDAAAGVAEPFTVGSAGGSGTFSGTITNAGGSHLLKFVKMGSGIETLTGANTYNGSTSINGGTLQLGDGLGDDGSIGNTSSVSNNASLVYNINGFQTASYPISGTGSLAMIGAGTVVLAASNGYGGGTYLGGAGGQLQLNSNNALGAATGALTINSGQLNLNGFNAAVAGLSGAGGSITTSSPATLSLAPTASALYSGSVGGATALTLNSPGVVQTIAGGATYTGATNVTAGTLAITGGSGLSTSPAVSVASGAALDVSQLSGGLSITSGTLNAGRTSSPAVDINGSVTLNNTLVTVAGGVTPGTMTIGGGLSFSSGTESYVPGDQIAASGPLTLGGVDYIVPTMSLASTTYTLFTYSGGLTGGTSDLAIAGVFGSNPRQSYHFGLSSGTAVTLIVSGLPGNLVWTGGSNQTWDNGASKSWFNTTSHTADYFFTGDNVTFDDTAGTANANVTISGGSAGSVQPGSLTVSNTTVSYSFSGDPIAGAAALVKNGPGSVALQSQNTYTGGTFVNSGTVNADGFQALGTGNVTLNGGVLTANSSDALGTGNVTVNGGTLNAYTNQSPNAVTLNGGQINAYTIGALGSGPLAVSGGTLLLGFAQGVSSVSLSGGLTVINDPGALGSGNVTLSAGSLDNQSGTPLTLNTASPFVWNGSFTFLGSNPLDLGSGSVSLNASSTVYVSGSTLQVDGAISGGGGLTKNGAGLLYLTGANSYGGGTTVSNGTLQLDGQAFTTTPGSYSVAAGATLALSDLGGGQGSGTSAPPNGTTTFAGSGTLSILSGWLNNNSNNHSTVNFAMGPGGLINIQSGGAIQNGGYGNTNWGGNFASMTVSGTMDIWDGNNVQVDALNGNGTITEGYGVNGGGAKIVTVGIAGGSGTYSGTITDNPAGGGTTHGGASGRINFTKTGAGIEVFNGGSNVSWGGGTTVSGGTLVLSDLPNYYGGFDRQPGGALYATGGNIAIQNGATLLVDANASQMQFTDTVLSGTGTFVKTGGNNLLLGYNGYVAYISFAAGSQINVLSGVLRNEYGNGNWNNNLASMYVASGATVDLWDSPGGITVDALTGAGIVQHTSFGGSENLTIGVAGGSGTFSGTLTDQPGSGHVMNLVKSGSGTEVLGSLSAITTATSNFSGNITVNGGTLIGAALSNGAATSFGLASNSRAITVNTGATLQFDAPNTFGQFFSSNAPTLNVNGGVVTNADPASSGAINNALNNVFLTGGTLTATTGQHGGYAAWNINGAIVSQGNSFISTSDPVYGTVMLAIGGASTGSTTFSVQSGTLTVSAPLVQDTVDGNVSGLAETGSGTLLLTASNTYTGSTTVTGSTLQLGTGLGSQDGSINGTNGVTLGNNSLIAYDLAGSQSATYSIVGTGSLTKLGAGELILSGTNTYTGGTTVAGGTLVATNNEALADGSSLTVGNASFFPAPAVPAPGVSAEASTVAPVPEPGTLPLAAAAIAGAVLWRGCRRAGMLRGIDVRSVH
jgi:autotransporter-associated beta strand protein